jgi:hypothetical protein
MASSALKKWLVRVHCYSLLAVPCITAVLEIHSGVIAGGNGVF